MLQAGDSDEGSSSSSGGTGHRPLHVDIHSCIRKHGEFYLTNPDADCERRTKDMAARKRRKTGQNTVGAQSTPPHADLPPHWNRAYLENACHLTICGINTKYTGSKRREKKRFNKSCVSVLTPVEPPRAGKAGASRRRRRNGIALGSFLSLKNCPGLSAARKLPVSAEEAETEATETRAQRTDLARALIAMVLRVDHVVRSAAV